MSEARRGGAIVLLHDVLPLVVGLPVLLGVVVTVGNILGVAHPDLGWAHTVANDAKALAIGEPLYADPSRHYTGMLYTPLYPLVLAPLYRLHWWDGWPPLVAALSGLVLAAAVGVVAARRVDAIEDRRVAVLGGIGLAGTAWWLVSANPDHFLHEGRGDQLAWCLALLGLCLLARSVSRAASPLWPAVALLVAAFWTKQTTVGATAAAVAAMSLWTLGGRVAPSTWRRFCVAIVLSNVLVLSVLWAVTSGWVGHFLITLPTRHHTDGAVARYIGEARSLLTISVLVLVIPAVAVVPWHDLRRRLRRPRGPVRSTWLSFAVALATVLVLFVVLSVPLVWSARRKQGGDTNQYIGIMWAIAFLIAVVHRECRRRVWPAGIGALTYGLLVLAVATPAVQRRLLDIGVALPSTFPAMVQPALSADLVAYAGTHEVYIPERGLVTVERPGAEWPAQWNIIDLLAAGDEPGYLRDALLDRRFDAVSRFDERWEEYATAYGRRAGGYLAMLNAVIDEGYVQGANGAPESLLGRRPGPIDLTWARACFAPGQLPSRCERLLGPP